MILTDPDDFRIRKHDFSASTANYPVLVIEAVQNVKITVEDFPKTDDSEHDFDDQHSVNSGKRC